METAGDALKLLSRQNPQDPVQALLDLLKNPYSAQLFQSSVYASLGTSIGFALLLAIGFSLLRPYNSVVYAPKLKVADARHAPPPVGKGIFAWVGPVLKTTEQELVTQIGLDAVVFLRILRMCRNLFLFMAIIGCGVLLPVNLSRKVYGTVNFIARVTPIQTYGSPIWSITICAWLFNIILIGLLWWNYRAVLRLRRQYFDSPEYHASLHARTLMMNDIPKDYRSDEGIGRVIDEVVPTSSFSRTAIARNVKELPELIAQHNDSVRQLESHLAKYLQNPDQLPAKRPECHPHKLDPSWITYPKGQKVDAIEYLSNRIRDLESEIKQVRLTVDNRNPLPYGFASYEEITEAHSIAYAARNKHPQGTTIVLAPRPQDIIWKNMPLNRSQRKRRRFLNNFYMLLLTLVWIAPNAMISIFLVNLSNLGSLWPAFQRSLEAHTTWWSIVQGVASPAITSLVYLVLPIIFRRMLIRAGDRTKTARERHVAAKLYTFFVFNFLIVFSVFSTIWSFVASVITNTQNKQDAWTAIKNADFGQALFISLCTISPFWITWLLQRNLGAAVDLAQIWSLIWSFAVRKFSSPTPRELIELTAPPAFDYASYYNYFLFYSTVAMCYGLLQPLCLAACAMYFSLDVYLKKYLLLYIFVTKIESGGMFWRMFFNRMIFASILSSLVVFLAVFVQGGGQHVEAYAVIPLPLIMIAFKVYCKRTFDDKIHYSTTLSSMQNVEATPRDLFSKNDRLASKFGHPALYQPLITPMVHARAQNKLVAIYGGRLTDSNNAYSGDTGSVSGYSDTYALDPMRKGKLGKTAATSIVPGFEMVPENRLDFSYFKSRAEFGDEHGGGGTLYGRPEDIMRSDTPGQSTVFGSDSRPATPTVGRSNFSRSTFDESGDLGINQYVGRDQKTEEEVALVGGAAAMPYGTPPINPYGDSRPGTPSGMGQNYRREGSVSLDRRAAPGFLGGAPTGYGGLPQEELESDPTSYDYFRSKRLGSRQY